MVGRLCFYHFIFSSASQKITEPCGGATREWEIVLTSPGVDTTHIIRESDLSLCVLRTEERVPPLLNLSISKSCQLSSTGSPLSTSQNPGQQSIADNEFIVDKVVLIDKEP